MILEKITSQCIRAVSAGMANAESRFERRAVEDLIVEETRFTIIEMYNGAKDLGKSNFIPDEIVLPVSLTFNKAIQDEEADYIVFNIESPMVRLNDHTNGAVYIGKGKTAKSFTQVKSWEHASMLYTLGEIYPGGHEHVMVESDKLVVFGNKQLKSLTVRAIWADPRKLTSFDEYNDDWPVPGDLIPRLIEKVAFRMMGIAAKQTPNQTNDGNDVTPVVQTQVK